MKKFDVGQRVVLRDVNERRRTSGPQMGTVTKVGRTLMYVDVGYGKPRAYRLDTGRANDNYGHSWVQTEGEYAEELRRREAFKRLTSHHLRFDAGYSHSVDVETVEKIADLLDREAS